jgi:malate dehydrogenase (oxaloacetate-decarboxylating)
MNYQKKAIEEHKKHKGKLSTSSKMKVTNKHELSIAYSPGVARPCNEIAEDKSKVYDMTWRSNLVAVISDGTAVLGLGDIGPEASLPVMEGKALLLKEFAGVDAVPIVVDETDVDKFVETVVNIAPSFSGINLEDISAPRCFEIEKKLKEKLDIPVFHDDQHGTAIVVLAGLINSAKVVEKDLKEMRYVINGAGAAGIATCKLLIEYGITNILLCDSKGIVNNNRNDLNHHKRYLLEYIENDKEGSLSDAMKDADVFLGLSVGDIVSQDMVRSMSDDPIIIAMANPTPEIDPKLAKEAGAKIIATGRSDYPNQINNVLGFPGIFRGLLDKRSTDVTPEIKIKAAKAIASLVEDPTEDMIIPDPFDKRVVEVVAGSI